MSQYCTIMPTFLPSHIAPYSSLYSVIRTWCLTIPDNSAYAGGVVVGGCLPPDSESSCIAVIPTAGFRFVDPIVQARMHGSIQYFY